MYMRSDSLTLTVPERFASSRTVTRSTEPEVFTFERIPAQVSAVRSYVPIRPKKRCTRVMYPAKVRMHLPPPERSQAKRWLLVLVLVVLWQIYTEEPCPDTPLGSTDSPVPDYQSLTFQSADLSPSSDLLSVSQTGCEGSSDRLVLPESSVPSPGQEADSSRSFEQSAGKSYMVALLVYHRLGADN